MVEKRKKIKEAAALRYNPDENSAPEVVAVGRGEIAEKLLELAEKSQVPVHEDPGLAHVLSSMELGSEIPPELYTVVAEILIFVGNLDKDLDDGHAGRL